MAKQTSGRGRFAILPKDELVEISRSGARALHDKGLAGPKFTTDSARKAARLGGLVFGLPEEERRAFIERWRATPADRDCLDTDESDNLLYDQAASYLRISVRTIYELVTADKLTSVATPSGRRIVRDLKWLTLSAKYSEFRKKKSQQQAV